MLNVNEQLERIVEVAIVLLVGAMISTGYWSLPGLMLAAVLFVVIRPLAVWIGVRDADAGGAPRRLLAWFGIRGIGSVYYAVYFAGFELRDDVATELLSAVFTVVAASIVLHGISAAPLMELYRARRGAGRKPGSPVVGQMMTGATPRSHVVSGAGRCAHRARQFQNERMNWDRISGNWTQWKGRIQERWGKLTQDQLDVIAGRREQLSGRIQEVYGLTKDETERQLRNWERNLAVEYDESDLVIDDDESGSTPINGQR